VRSSDRRSLRNREALACLCDRQRRWKKSVLNHIEIRTSFLLTTFFVVAFYNQLSNIDLITREFPTIFGLLKLRFLQTAPTLKVRCILQQLVAHQVPIATKHQIKYQSRPNIRFPAKSKFFFSSWGSTVLPFLSK